MNPVNTYCRREGVGLSVWRILIYYININKDCYSLSCLDSFVTLPLLEFVFLIPVREKGKNIRGASRGGSHIYISVRAVVNLCDYFFFCS